MSHEASLREHLLYLLEGGGAHASFDSAIDGIPPETRGVRPEGLPYSCWELLEHLRLAQWDILEFSRNPDHVSPEWPKGYWPENPEPPDDQAWKRSIAQFKSDLAAICELVENPDTQLYAPIPGGDGQTILREALLVADHNAYHIGQLVLVRRLLHIWKA